MRTPRQIYSFALTVTLVGASVAALPAGSAHAADWIFATVWNSGDSMNHLVQIDVLTGGVTDVGAVTVTGQPGHVPGLTGLSPHTDGQLYAFDTYGNQIITIDTTTAVGTLVTPVGDDLGGVMFGLAIEHSGDYYVTGQQLRKGTLPGPTYPVGLLYSDTDSCDLAPNGTLYATDGDALRTIDKTTGVQTEIRSWPGGSIAGIAIDGPIAWAIDNGDSAPGNQWLVTIDLDDGDLTYLHNLPFGYYLATAVPEPASLALLALGGLALLRRRRGALILDCL